MAPRYTLGSDSRLKREQHIKTLFQSGKAFSVFPLRIIWLLQPRGAEPSSTCAGFSAPKKKFKRAVDRGRIKRLLREAWRLQRHDLQEVIPEGQQLQLFFLFTDITLPKTPAVNTAMEKAIEKLKKLISGA